MKFQRNFRSSIPHFIQQLKIDTSELEKPDSNDYANFNEFFFRKLKPGKFRRNLMKLQDIKDEKGARPADSPHDPDVVVSPADCRLTAFTSIQESTTYW